MTILTGARAGDGELSEELRGGGADTIVILMGVSHLRRIAEELISAGRSQNTPVAVIRWGTCETQQTVVGTLLNIAELVERERLRAPAVIVIGEVVRLREQLEWFQQSPAREIQLEVAA